jgi:hypothetical protein
MKGRIKMNQIPSAPNAPGKTMLLVTGILLVVFNTIGALLLLTTLNTIDFWLWAYGGQAMRATWTMIYTMGILLSLVVVVLGILGIVFCNRPEQARMLVILTGTVIGFTLMHNIVYMFYIADYTADGLFSASIFSIFAGLAIPIIFLIGARRNHSFHMENEARR